MNGPCIKLIPLEDVFPEGALADAIDEALQRSLPPVAGLDEAHTPEQRNAAYAAAIASQRAEFIELHGEPYGWERRVAPRDEARAPQYPLVEFVAAD